MTKYLVESRTLQAKPIAEVHTPCLVEHMNRETPLMAIDPSIV